MKEEFNLREERIKLFNSIPFFDVEGWDRTKIADAIREQDKTFIQKLNIYIESVKKSRREIDENDFSIWILSNLQVEIDTLAGENKNGI